MKKIEIPFFIRVATPIIGWAVLCAFLGYILIYLRADFESTGTQKIFVVSFPIYVFLIAIYVGLRYGGYLGKTKTRNGSLDTSILFRKIENGRLKSDNITEKEAEEVLNVLAYLMQEALRAVWKHGGFIVFLAVISEYISSGFKTTNLLVITLAGIISLFLLGFFSYFFAQTSISPIIKECRRYLKRRDFFYLTSLKNKFNLLFLVPLLVVSVMLFCVPSVGMDVVLISVVGLLMAIIVNNILYKLIYQTFLEIEEFSKNLPKGEKAIFATGTLDREVLSLGSNLNKTSQMIYESKTKLEKSQKELEQKTQELEKFYKATIKRELKMVGLKEEIENFKNEENKT